MRIMIDGVEYEAVFRTDFTEEMKSKDVMIFGDFATLHGGMQYNTWMECFWEKHAYERRSGEGWLALIAENIWCTETKGWMELVPV